MNQTRGVESLVEMHRHELINQAGPVRARRGGPPTNPHRAVRRAVAPRVGAWLIGFGTKLGGATVRTTN